MNYKRLRLNAIDSFELTPNAPTQFIVGTNGAGKSSVTKECSLLPPDKVDYDKGGSKFASCEKGGSIFNAYSYEKDGTWTHSFEKDGKELNEGGTISVQLQLVKDYLNYTPEIHALITGQDDMRFTKMSAADRRKWFTILPNANYEYVVGVYKRVTEKFNENRHALKRAKDRLVIESAKLLPPEELEQLRNICSDMYVQAQGLIERRKPLLDPSHTYVERSNRAAAHYKDVATRALQNIKRVRGMDKTLPRSPNELQDELSRARANLANLQTQSNQYYQDNERIQRLWEGMQATQLENAAQIQKQLDDCEEAIKVATGRCHLPHKQTADAATTIASCDKVLAWWPDVQAGFHDDTDRNWFGANLTELNGRIDSKKHTLNQLNSMIARHEQIVDHQTSHQGEQNVSCPKCSHTFQPNFSELTLQAAKEKLAGYQKQHETLHAELMVIAQEQSDIHTYIRHYNSVLQHLKNVPGLESFASWVVAEYILIRSPSSFSNHLNAFREQAGQWRRIELAETKRSEILVLSRELLARDSGGMSVADERSRLEALIGECEFNKTQAQARINSLTTMLQLVTSLVDLQAQLQKGVETVDKLHYEASDSLRRETFAQILRELQTQLNIKEAALMAAERQQSVIEHIESEIFELTENVEDYKLLQKELSPTEGLIAEGLIGFMDMFVEQMNKTCAQLFSYPLRILPSATDSDGVNLNYKFPIKVDKEVRADITKGSTGMKDVFDLAFVIASMKALGLSDYPIFLDEFGKSLDPVHKRATVSLLTSLMELESFEQIFMISHEINQYASIGRSEICVLHEANATIPHGCTYNKHVKFNEK